MKQEVAVNTHAPNVKQLFTMSLLCNTTQSLLTIGEFVTLFGIPHITIIFCILRIVKLLKTVETPPPSRKIKCNNAKEPLSVYYCHVCGLEYIMKFNLELHLEKQHTEEDRNALPE